MAYAVHDTRATTSGSRIDVGNQFFNIDENVGNIFCLCLCKKKITHLHAFHKYDNVKYKLFQARRNYKENKQNFVFITTRTKVNKT